MSQLSNPSFLERVQHVDPERVALPVLRELVVEVQSKTQNAIAAERRHWTDDKWSQWREHTSHNPW